MPDLEDMEEKLVRASHFVWALMKAASEKLRWVGTNFFTGKIYSLAYFNQPVHVQTIVSLVKETWGDNVHMYPVQRTGPHPLKKEVIRLLVEPDLLRQCGTQEGIPYIKNFPPINVEESD